MARNFAPGISSCADTELRTDNDPATIFQHSSRAGDMHVNGVRTAMFELRRCRDRKGVPTISITGSRQVLAKLVCGDAEQVPFAIGKIDFHCRIPQFVNGWGAR